MGVQLSVIQLLCILILATLGGGFLSMPRDLAEIAKQDSWISALLGGITLLVSTFLALRTAQKFPNQSLDDYAGNILGSFFGRIHAILLAVFFLVIAGIEVRTLTAIVKLFLLDKTPAELIGMLALFVVYRLTMFGLESAMNFYTFIIAPVILISLTIVFPIWGGMDMQEIKPFFQDWKLIVMAVPKTLYAYTGPQLLVGFLYTALRHKEKANFWVFISVSLLIAYYTLIQIVALAVFSAEELHYVMYPTLMIFRAVEIEAGFLERLDALALLTYLPINVAAISIWQGMASHILAKQARIEGVRAMALLLIVVTFVIANFPTDLALVRKLTEWAGDFAVYYTVLFIPLLWALAKLRGAKKHTANEQPF
jgi:spore germination protein